MVEANWYLEGKVIGTSKSIIIPENPILWEFYLRRKGWYYFRRFGNVIKVELNENNSKIEQMKKIKYGMTFEIETD